MPLVKLEKQYYLSFLTFIFFLIVVFGLHHFFFNNIKQQIRTETTTFGKQTARDISNVVINDVRDLNNLKNRLEFTNGDFFRYWNQEAEIIIKQNKSFKFIEWIDSSMVIQKIVPKQGNEAVIGLDISKVAYRSGNWKKNTKDSVINITPWIEMTQGGKAFLVDIPVYFRGNFQGTITAGMDFQEHFNAIIDLFEKEYAILIEDENGTPFYNKNNFDKSALSPKNYYHSILRFSEFGNKEWDFWFTPYQHISTKGKVKYINLSLIIGIFISFLLGLLVYYYLSTRKENEKVSLANKQLKFLNDSLEKERKKAEKASKAKTEFLSNMSHEIRTPLNAILGFIEVLKDSELSQNHKKYLSLMDLSSKKLLTQINDVLEFDRIESGKIELKEEIFSPTEELKNLVKIYAPSASDKKITLDIDFLKNNHHNVIGDAGKFSQVFTNLIRNSIKFTDKGSVSLTYTERVEYNKLFVRVFIKDTGIGIPKRKLSAIFDRFTQVDSGKNKRYEGGGIGLSITYYLLELMKGTISVKSIEFEGTEFEVKLSFPLTNRPATIEEFPEVYDLDLKNLKVLLVDDNTLNITVLEKSLEKFGIKNPDIAKNGYEAIGLARVNHYDLIFMDIHMPEIDGFEATLQIRKTNRDTIIFGLSANVTKEAIDEAIQVGMNDYITKPFSLKKLYIKLYYYFVSQQNTQK